MTLDKANILGILTSLSKSQGKYSRMLSTIDDGILNHLEEQNFNDAVDLILYLEG